MALRVRPIPQKCNASNHGIAPLSSIVDFLSSSFTAEHRVNAVDESSEFLEFSKAGDLENIQVIQTRKVIFEKARVNCGVNIRGRKVYFSVY